MSRSGSAEEIARHYRLCLRNSAALRRAGTIATHFARYTIDALRIWRASATNRPHQYRPPLARREAHVILSISPDTFASVASMSVSVLNNWQPCHPWLWHLLRREAVDALKEHARGWPPT
jgi:hypothetical protein